MTTDARLEVAKEIFNDCNQLLLVKGKAYSSKEDSLANFYRNAERLGLTPFQIWAVYFNKHIDSINNAIQYHPDSPKDESEGLQGRIRDAITYLTILECLLKEKEQENNVTFINPYYDYSKYFPYVDYSIPKYTTGKETSDASERGKAVPTV